ncbi:MAG: MBL fold metallo-hydrolase [Gammaproteobacteria bacterium]|nr:MBL fold metallo-hydrolase [Gammaproteobacteria bacterium]
MKKSAIVAAILLIIVAVGASQKERILTTLMQKGLESRFGSDLMNELEDGLHLGLCGAGGPLPAPNASGPCLVVIAGDRMFVVDAGTDGLRNLGRMGLQAGRIEALFLTHFHSDHIDGLGEMATIRWVGAANKSPLPVYGPTGATQVVEGFNTAYKFDHVYRHEHHGESVAPLSGAGMIAQEFTTPELGVLSTLIDDGDLVIEALAVGHVPVVPAVGYRFTYKNRSLLITGDTIAMDNIREFSKGVDLLVHEALAPNLVMQMNAAARKLDNKVLEKVTIDILDYHASPIEAAEAARDANVGHLLYYHIVPPLVIPGQASLYLNGAEDIFPDYTIGQDGVMFSMPSGSKDLHKIRKSL